MEKNSLQKIIAVSVAIAIAGYAIGYTTAPREILDEEVESQGLFGQETRRVLSATVTSLTAEQKLVVYRYAGSASVEVHRSRFGDLVQATQQLTVPAVVTYQLDMKRFGDENVTFDEPTKTVSIKLPPLKMGEVAFQSERAKVDSQGLLTLSDDVVQELLRTNYRTARKAVIKQAQQPTIFAAARDQAVKSATAQFEVPLRAAGLTGVRVRAYFPA